MGELREELDKRGTAEVINGKVCQVTQALDETEDTATFLACGVLIEAKTIPIAEACSKCDSWKRRFDTVELCQAKQGKDARARGFHKVVCPAQFQKQAAK